MSCDDQRQLITAYFDGELDREEALVAERHLAACPACARRLAAERALRASIQAAGLRHEPTRAQTRRLRATLRRAAAGAEAGAGFAASGSAAPGFEASGFEASDFAASGSAAPAGAPWERFKAPVTAVRSWRRLDAVAAALLVALLSFALGRAWPVRTAASSTLAHEVVASHVRSLLAGHLADVASSDRHTVKPWFTGKLDYAPPVFDLAAQGFPLAGGRLDYLDGHPVAALVYRAGPHTVNLFTWPAAGPASPPAAATERGFHLLCWTRSGMTWWAVSDIAADRLDDFARRLRAEVARAGA
jgi:anti-sigma factor RsiW